MLNSLRSHAKDLLPDSVLLGQLVLRRASDWQKRGLIFIHIPKNGGTSINTALYGRFMGHYRIRDIERIKPNLLRTLPSFAVTRNPWARAYSAWCFARKGAEMVDGAQIRSSQRYQAPEFENFERFVLEWLPSRKLDREDYVFRPQTHFLLDSKGTFNVSHLGQIEEPQTYMPFLQESLGYRPEIKHLNRTADSTNYRKAYNLEMRNTLARCYASDLEKLNYDF